MERTPALQSAHPGPRAKKPSMENGRAAAVPSGNTVSRFVAGQKPGTDTRSEIDEFARKADGLKMVFHNLRCTRNAGRISCSGIEVHELSEVFNVFF